MAEIRKKNIPVIDVINGISSPELSAKSLVSFGEMGAKAGEFLAKLHPAGSTPVKVAWFPGPTGAGWVEAGNTGFIDAVKGSAVEVVETKYGDTGKEVQSKLIEDTLEAHPDVELHRRHRGDGRGRDPDPARPRTDGPDQGGRLLLSRRASTRASAAARSSPRRPTSTVIQGRIAIDQAVRILEGKDYLKHVGPALFVVTKDNVDGLRSASTLAPDGFAPIFRVE